MEFEADLAFHGEVLKTCPRCGIQTHRRQCPECEIKLTGDAEMDQVMADIEAGKEVEDLDALLRPGRKPDEQFEPVKPGEMP